MKRVHFEVEETAVTIVSDEKYLDIAKDAIFTAREIVTKKINLDPFFRITFEPYPVSENDDDLIRRMCEASAYANVGPMAGVAGAIATYAVERMVEAGAEFAIVENGGDIALRINRDITVGLYDGQDKINDLALRVKKRDTIFGICSSSGRIGPSVSFGNSKICTVISENVILADASATALGNLMDDDDSEKMKNSLKKIGSIHGIDGCIASSGDSFGMFGNVPELIKCRIDTERISRIIY